jgi:hypothetical protein
MSLFSKLQRLISDGKTRSEDFHTEIVAQVLQNSPELTVKWLATLDLTKPEEADAIFVATQEEYDPLETHDRGSRPDISIRLEKHGLIELVFLESKVGSEEGDNQLEHYADQLTVKSGLERRSLVYVTRDFEPKQPPKNSNIQFRQLRWYDFYRFLKNEPQTSDLVKELITFMEENNMSQSNQFSTIDILALSNFQKARKIMDTTMWEDVLVKFKRVCGGDSSPKKGMIQFRDNDRYVMIVGHGEGWQFEILLGYWMGCESLTDYPKIGVQIYVSPKAKSRNQIVSAMRDFEKIKNGAWTSSDLANDHEWGSIYQKKGIQDFLAEDDQVKKIIEYFSRLLDDVAEFRKQYPKLPWTAQQTDNEEA